MWLVVDLEVEAAMRRSSKPCARGLLHEYGWGIVRNSSVHSGLQEEGSEQEDEGTE